LLAELAGAGQERMMRELWELIERYTQARPLLLVTEDLHWSDHGTLRLMDYFARRREALRLHWVATFRLAQVIAEDHPLRDLRHELRLHKLSDEVLLDPFSESEVAAYVDARVPGSGVSETFVRALHEHTDGLPLFVANVLDALLEPRSGRSGADELGAASGKALPVPDNLAGAIEKQLSKLPAPMRAVLEAASVCGMEFRAATVAELIDSSPSAVMDRCDDLVRREYWLREAGIVDTPSGDLDAKYVFKHAVYRHVFYQRLATAHRVAFHRRAARSLERAGAASAAELASHQELGREFRAAAASYALAADRALGHFAHQEALALTEQGLALLPQLADGDERQEIELSLTAARGHAFVVLNGIDTPDTVAAFERVRELCESLPESPSRALLQNTAGWWFLTRSDYPGALELAGRIRAIGEKFDDALLVIYGHNLAGVAHGQSGRYLEARDALASGIALYDRSTGLALSQIYVDPEASMCANIAPALAHLGFADQARRMAQRALVRSRSAGPMGRLVALWCGSLTAIRLEDVDAADALATEFEELVATTPVQQARGPARWFRGWVEIQRGRTSQGLALVREGVAMYRASGTSSGDSETLAYAAEALVLEQRWDEAEAALAEATAHAERFDERSFATEHALLGARIADGRGNRTLARELRVSAVETARRRHALWSELKARLALAAAADATPADVAALRATYASVAEGLDTRVCERARGLLAIDPVAR
jgi:tetratricopeptide (TPR) repeat protein